MAFRPLETIKAHPYLAAGGVFVLGVVLVIILSGGNSEPANAQTVVGVGTDPNTVAANTALVQGQLAAGVANQQTAAQLAVSMADIQAGQKVAELNAQNDASKIASETQVALATLSAQKDTQSLVSTLSAQVSQAQIASQQAIAANSNATNVQIAKLNADSQVQMQNFMTQVQQGAQQRDVNLAMIAANRDIQITTANNAAQASLATTFANASVATTISNNATQAGMAATYAGMQTQLAGTYAGIINNQTAAQAATEAARIEADRAKYLAEQNRIAEATRRQQEFDLSHQNFVAQTNANLQNTAMTYANVYQHQVLYEQALASTRPFMFNNGSPITGTAIDWKQFGNIAA